MSGVDQVPDWALERAKELHRAAGGATTPMAHAFARYIAAHEEAPVDPVDHAIEGALSFAAADSIFSVNDELFQSDGADLREFIAKFRDQLSKRGIELAKTGGAA